MNPTGPVLSCPPAPSRIAALDGLRAIAVLLVLAGHGAAAYGLQGAVWWRVPMTNASFGVRLFFVLSGYLITRLLLKEFQQHGTISLKAFYIRRSLRIFPAFYFFLATVAVLAAAGWVDVSGPQWASAATYTWNYAWLWSRDGPAGGSWFLGHLWTLSLEEQFYLWWPGFILLTGWRGARLTAWLLPVVLPLVRVASYWFFPEQRGALGMMFHTAIDSILVGCAFSLYEEKLSAWLSGKPWVPVLAAGFALVVSPLMGARFQGAYFITMGFGLDAICAGFLILHVKQGGAGTKALSWGPLRLVGTWSYSLYLWQQLFLTPYNTTWSGRFPACFGALFACALFSYYVVEQPILRFKRHFERS